MEAAVKAEEDGRHAGAEEGGRGETGVVDGLQEEGRGALLGGNSYIRGSLPCILGLRSTLENQNT